MTRKLVYSSRFWATIAKTFGATSGLDGEASQQDFRTLDLPAIQKRFAEEWDNLPLWQQHHQYRADFLPGRCAHMYYVVGQEQPDQTIKLVEIEIELEPPT